MFEGLIEYMRKDEIIKVALRLFLLRGYRSVSLSDVANELGITKGGIYHYFKSKEDMLIQTAEFFFDLIKTKHIELFDNDKGLYEILQAVIRDNEIETYINNFIGNKAPNDEMGLLFEFMTLCPELLRHWERVNLEIITAIQGKLQKLIDKGEMRSDVEVNALAAILFTLMIGRRTISMQYADPSAREQIVENLCKMVST
ncbi:MAG: ttgR [Firmicutes bacterium]|nr:ttgR [Bacillota bacterium]